MLAAALTAEVAAYIDRFADQLDEHGSVDHEAGTPPLGGEHVNPAGRVPPAAGAYVIGPATFPRSGAANPSLTTLTLARHTARTLAADHC
ncbi:hypothetical protein A4G26_07715 [Mycobacterium kansasii]|uniref:Glucose-methanol-choline oxidoreductase C-terminal domain-containing protein n=2 Tax=Mycobacterium innocens TaxID=2341083 RepID=A0A498QA31_9MYCO|nr:hypothetical protein A4G26_07715 [Mycobacterium kansasii]VBA40680.1 hypothetical protein LAUMK13_03176 [Mycobacterium innocens]